MIDIYVLDVANLYQSFGSGFIIGFFLCLISGLIVGVIDMVKGLFKEA